MVDVRDHGATGDGVTVARADTDDWTIVATAPRRGVTATAPRRTVTATTRRQKVTASVPGHRVEAES